MLKFRILNPTHYPTQINSKQSDYKIITLSFMVCHL